MSTEAAGDGKPDTAGPDAGAEVAEPTAMAVDEPAAGVPRQAGAPDEAAGAGEAAEADGDYDERADDGVAVPGVDDEILEYDEEYEGYESEEPDEFAQPRRARRWPRLLLVLGFVVLAVAIVGGAVAIVGSLTHGFKKPVKVTYKSSPVFSLKTGDCFDPQGQQSFTLLSCDSPHQAEVFATFALTGTNWPGDAAVQADASGGCSGRLTGYVNPQLAINLSSTYVYPDSVAWQAGTRTVICEVRAASGELTGTVRGASASAG